MENKSTSHDNTIEIHESINILFKYIHIVEIK